MFKQAAAPHSITFRIVGAWSVVPAFVEQADIPVCLYIARTQSLYSPVLEPPDLGVSAWVDAAPYALHPACLVYPVKPTTVCLEDIDDSMSDAARLAVDDRLSLSSGASRRRY